MDSHRAAFVAEAEEGITDLNNALLALEADPADAAAMDDVFRVAHTLKGNAAAMGYDRVSDLGHALEDLLDDVRAGDRAVTPDLMDLLFEGVDAVEAMVGEIATDGAVSTDPTDLAERLRAWEESDDGGDDDDAPRDEPDDTGSGATAERGAAVAPEGVDAVSPPDPAAVASVAADLDPGGETLVHARVELGESAMPGVDATFVLGALEGFGPFRTVPDRDALEDGAFAGGFDCAVVAADPATVEAGLEALVQVEGVAARAAGDDAPADDAVATEGRDDAVDTDEPDDATEDDGSAAADAEETNGDTHPAAPDRERISSVRVDVDQVDDLYGLVEQLVTSRIKLRRELDEAGVDSEALDQLDKLAADLQDTAMDMRLIPFSQVADAFPRLVRDVSRDLDKRVDFAVEGADVELDRTILTEIRDPLVHVLRNAVDHGIESPEEREAAGKDPAGTVRLVAERDRDHVVIEVRDDGGGLDADALRRKALEEGVVTRAEAEAMSDAEAYDLVFHPGLSTNEEVTAVSGRGVGMDVVRTTARDLDGSVSVESEPGGGTTVRFRLPVTVAIVKVMFVEVGGTEYGVPIKTIAEVDHADGIEAVHGREVVRHEDDLYPVIRLADRLGEAEAAGPSDAGTTTPAADGGERPSIGEGTGTAIGGEARTATGSESAAGSTDGEFAPEPTGVPADGGMLVRIRGETRQVALHCDAVLDQEEVVVKPLDGPLSGTPGLSGTAVLGDGDVVAVLDVVSL